MQSINVMKIKFFTPYDFQGGRVLGYIGKVYKKQRRLGIK